MVPAGSSPSCGTDGITWGGVWLGSFDGVVLPDFSDALVFKGMPLKSELVGSARVFQSDFLESFWGAAALADLA